MIHKPRRILHQILSKKKMPIFLSLSTTVFNLPPSEDKFKSQRNVKVYINFIKSNQLCGGFVERR